MCIFVKLYYDILSPNIDEYILQIYISGNQRTSFYVGKRSLHSLKINIWSCSEHVVSYLHV